MPTEPPRRAHGSRHAWHSILLSQSLALVDHLACLDDDQRDDYADEADLDFNDLATAGELGDGEPADGPHEELQAAYVDENGWVRIGPQPVSGKVEAMSAKVDKTSQLDARKPPDLRKRRKTADTAGGCAERRGY